MQLQYKALATGGTVHFSGMPGYLRAGRAGSSACWVNTQPAQEALEQQRRKSVTWGGSQATGTGWRGRFDGPGYLKQGKVGVGHSLSVSLRWEGCSGYNKEPYQNKYIQRHLPCLPVTPNGM